MKSETDRHGVWGGMNMTVLRAFALGKNWLTPQRRPVVGSRLLSLFRLLLRCQPQCMAGTVLEKVHPLEETGCMFFGRAATSHFQNFGWLPCPEAWPAWGWSVLIVYLFLRLATPENKVAWL